MNSDKGSSARTSAATSETSPPSPNEPAEKLTEDQYLDQQAHAAKLAMAKAWEQLKAKLGEGVAPQAWAREYPWITVGAAAVAGFVAASTLIPSKEEQALKKLAAIERALSPAPRKSESVEGNGHDKKGSPSLMSTILREALAVARPAIISLITANIAPPPPEEQQGQPQNPSQGAQPGSAS